MKINKLLFLVFLIACWSCKADIEQQISLNDDMEQTSNQQTKSGEDEQPATDSENEQSADTDDETSLPDEVATGNINLPDYPDYYAEIALNLSKMGSYDYKLLTGKWDLSHYAFTEDGITIKDGADMRYGYFFTIHELDLVRQGLDSKWSLGRDMATWRIDYTLYPNSYFINLAAFQILYMMYDFQPMITLTQELNKAVSFVIKEDCLIILFQSEENRNLIILKKQES